MIYNNLKTKKVVSYSLSMDSDFFSKFLINLLSHTIAMNIHINIRIVDFLIYPRGIA